MRRSEMVHQRDDTVEHPPACRAFLLEGDDVIFVVMVVLQLLLLHRLYARSLAGGLLQRFIGIHLRILCKIRRGEVV